MVFDFLLQLGFGTRFETILAPFWGAKSRPNRTWNGSKNELKFERGFGAEHLSGEALLNFLTPLMCETKLQDFTAQESLWLYRN